MLFEYNKLFKQFFVVSKNFQQKSNLFINFLFLIFELNFCLSAMILWLTHISAEYRPYVSHIKVFKHFLDTLYLKLFKNRRDQCSNTHIIIYLLFFLSVCSILWTVQSVQNVFDKKKFQQKKTTFEFLKNYLFIWRFTIWGGKSDCIRAEHAGNYAVLELFSLEFWSRNFVLSTTKQKIYILHSLL